MTEINRQPTGLSDLLQVQAGGRNPDDLSQSVRPTVDIEPFYWPDRMRGFVEPFALTAGQADFIEVPPGEVWKLLTVGHVSAVIAVGEAYSYTYGIERLPGQGLNGVEFHGGQFTAAAIGANADFVQLAHPLIVTAGQRITITCISEIIAGSFQGGFEIIFVQMNI